MRTLNDAGLGTLAHWLAENHRLGFQLLAENRLGAWAAAAEADPDHLVEIPARDSRTRQPVTLTLDNHHFTEE